jgi:hypothetical protein
MLVVSMNSFAERIISPALGVSNVFSTSEAEMRDSGYYYGSTYRNKNSLSWTPMNFGLSLGTVHEKGFTLLFSVDALFIGNINASHEKLVGVKSDKKFTAKAKIGGGAVAQGNVLFGYTYKGIPKLYLTFASGLTLGGGVNKVKEISSLESTISNIDVSLKTANFGVPLYLSVSYYFTDKIGINVGFLNSFCGGLQWYEEGDLSVPYLGTGYDISMPAFINIFTFNVGPTFKL